VAFAAGGNADLRAAEAAFVDGRYQDVLPVLERIDREALSKHERVRALELEAMTRAAFRNKELAIEAFRRILGIDPDYTPAPDVSPKILGLVEEARRRGPLAGESEAPASGAGPESAHAEPATGEPRPSIAVAERSPPPAAMAESTPGKKPGPAESGALVSRWWFWAAIATLVAAVVAGSVVAASAGSKPPSGNLGSGNLNP
jgi:hypothetical protein